MTGQAFSAEVADPTRGHSFYSQTTARIAPYSPAYSLHSDIFVT